MRRHFTQIWSSIRRRRDRRLRNLVHISRASRLESLETRYALDGSPFACFPLSQAHDDSFQFLQDTQSNESGSSVLDNDYIASACATELTISLVADVQHGALQLEADGTFTYSPASGFTGIDAFQYSLFDGNTNSNALVTLFVFSDNIIPPFEGGPGFPGGTIPLEPTLNPDPDNFDPPFNPPIPIDPDLDPDEEPPEYCQFMFRLHAVNDEITVWHDSVNNRGNIFENDWSEHPCQRRFQASIATPPSHGTASIYDDGTYTYTPASHYVGTDSFVYRVTDGFATVSATVSVQVENDQPMACDDPFQTYPRTDHFSQQNGGTDPCYSGFHFGYPGLDDPGDPYGWSPARGYYVWNAPNSSPFQLTGSGVLQNDMDADPLTASLVCRPLFGTVELDSSGSFTYRPNQYFQGEDFFTYRASDGIVSDTAMVWLDVHGDREQLTPRAGFREATEQRIQLGIATIQDRCTGQELYLGGHRYNEQLIEENGVRYDRESEAAPVSSYWYQATEDTFVDENDTVFHRTTWDWGNWQSPEDSSARSELLQADWYSDGEFLYIQKFDQRIYLFDLRPDSNISWGDNTNSPAEFDLLWLDFTPNAWTPDANEEWWINEGAVFVTGKAEVYGTHTYQASQDFTVHTFMDQPWFMAQTELVAEVSNARLQATGRNFVSPEGVNGLHTVATFTDENTGDPASLYSAQIDWGDGTFPTAGVVTGESGSFSVQGTHTYQQWGTYFTRITILDKDNVEVTTQGSARIENLVPVAIDDSYVTSHAHNLVTHTNAAPFGVLHNDLDPGNGLTAVLVSGPAHGTLSLNNNGTFTYHPHGTYLGVDQFSYRASDGNEASEPAMVTIQVTNSPPLAVDDEKEVPHDRVTLFELRTNDSDPDSDPLQVRIVDPPTNGEISIAADGRVQYQPLPAFVGSDSFTYVVYDGFEESNIGTVNLSVMNRAPTATNDSYLISHDRDLFANVTANDADLDNDPLVVTVVSDVSHGELTMQSNGSFQYRPEVAFVGTDSFTYFVSDGLEETSVVTATITVKNDNPVVSHDSYTLPHGRSLTANVTANDSDGDGDTLVVTLVSNDTVGDLQLQANGQFTYQPPTNFMGLVHFTYRVFDGITLSDVATATIHVKNDAPSAANDVFNLSHDRVLNGSVVANDHDPDGDSLTFILDASVATGQLNWQSNGSFTYTPATGFVGIVTFQYHATDGLLSSGTATVTIHVQNNAPVANNDSFSVIHDRTLTGNILSNDGDADADPITFQVISGFSHGQLTLETNGQFVYQPATGFVGTDTLSYKLYDGLIYSQLATVTIAVTNNAPVATNDSYPLGVAAGNTTIAFDVRTNDTDGDQDVLSVEVIQPVSHGTLTQNADGTFQYAPAVGYVGIDQFSYRLSDSVSFSNVATVTLRILPLVTIDSTANTTEGSDVGYFRLGRASPFTDPLFVSYSIDASSTATNGLDFDYLSGTSAANVTAGSIEFGAGQEFVDIPIHAIDDQISESTENVTIQLIGDDQAYRIDSTSRATVHIADHFLDIRDLRLIRDTGRYDFDRATFDPRVTGTVVGGFRGGNVKLEFDHGHDLVADGIVTVSNSGDIFTYDPRQFDATVVDKVGSFILRYRWLNVDSAGVTLQAFPWRVFGMYLEPDPALGDARVDQLALVRDTNVANDKITIDPAVTGRVLGNLLNGSARVEVDHNGDGVPEGSVNVADSGDLFTYDPRAHDPSFAQSLGPVTLGFHVMPTDLSVPAGDDIEFSFTLESLPESTFTIANLSHSTTESSVSIDGMVAPAIPGAKIVFVDLDLDGNGVADTTFRASNQTFSQALRDATYGEFFVAARTREWSDGYGAYLVGEWTTYDFIWGPMPAPEITLLRLVQDTGSSNTDAVTTNPAIRGELECDTLESEATKIQLDLDEDWIADTTTWSDSGGHFGYTPVDLDFGQIVIRARSTRWDFVLQEEIFGEWVTLSYTLERGTVPTITQFALVKDTGSSSTDKVTQITAVSGILVPPGNIGDIEVQFDQTGDGLVDGVTTSNSAGQFMYLPTGLEAGLNELRVRATQRDINSGELVTGAWQSLTFTYEISINQPITVADLHLWNDDGPSSTDLIATDPSITGTLFNDGDVAYSAVEVDIDGDEAPDATVAAESDGRFVFTPLYVEYGEQTFSARGVEWNYSTREAVRGPWASISFSYVQSQNTPPIITTFQLLSDSGSSNNDGLTENIALVGQVTDDVGWRSLIVQFDIDGDNQYDFHTFSDELGNFSFQPLSLSFGANTVSARALEWDRKLGAYLTGEWSSASFVYEDQLDQAARLIELDIASPEPVVESSHRGPTISGRISNESGLEKIGIEIDVNGDGVVDRSTNTDDAGQFELTLAGLAAGSQLIGVRTREFDSLANAFQYSNWQATTFTNEYPTIAAPAIVSLHLLQDPASAPGHARGNPRLYGTLDRAPYREFVTLEFDHDGDGDVDGTTVGGGDLTFDYLASGLPIGPNVIRARTKDYSADGVMLRSDWVSLPVTIDAPVEGAPIIATLLLVNDSGASNNDRSTKFPQIKGTVGNTLPGTAIVFEFDHNHDGIEDGFVQTTTGQFTNYTPAGISKGWVTIAARARTTDGASIGPWTSIGYVYADNPDSSDSQNLIAAVNTYRNALQDASTEAGAAASQANSQADAASDAATSLFDDETNSIAEERVSEVEDSHADYQASTGAANIDYLNALSNVSSQFGVDIVGFNGNTTSFPFTSYTWPTSPEGSSLEIPADSTQPKPPLAAPITVGPAYDLSADAVYQTAIVMAQLAESFAVSAANQDWVRATNEAHQISDDAVLASEKQYQRDLQAAEDAFQIALSMLPITDLTAAYIAAQQANKIALDARGAALATIQSNFQSANNVANATASASTDAAWDIYVKTSPPGVPIDANGDPCTMDLPDVDMSARIVLESSMVNIERTRSDSARLAFEDYVLNSLDAHGLYAEGVAASSFTLSDARTQHAFEASEIDSEARINFALNQLAAIRNHSKRLADIELAKTTSLADAAQDRSVAVNIAAANRLVAEAVAKEQALQQWDSVVGSDWTSYQHSLAVDDLTQANELAAAQLLYETDMSTATHQLAIDNATAEHDFATSVAEENFAYGEARMDAMGVYWSDTANDLRLQQLANNLRGHDGAVAIADANVVNGSAHLQHSLTFDAALWDAVLDYRSADLADWTFFPDSCHGKYKVPNADRAANWAEYTKAYTLARYDYEHDYFIYNWTAAASGALPNSPPPNSPPRLAQYHALVAPLDHDHAIELVALGETRRSELANAKRDFEWTSAGSQKTLRDSNAATAADLKTNIAVAEKTFLVSAATSYQSTIDAWATANPSPWSEYQADLASATLAWTIATSDAEVTEVTDTALANVIRAVAESTAERDYRQDESVANQSHVAALAAARNLFAQDTADSKLAFLLTFTGNLTGFQGVGPSTPPTQPGPTTPTQPYVPYISSNQLANLTYALAAINATEDYIFLDGQARDATGGTYNPDYYALVAAPRAAYNSLHTIATDVLDNSLRSSWDVYRTAIASSEKARMIANGANAASNVITNRSYADYLYYGPVGVAYQTLASELELASQDLALAINTAHKLHAAELATIATARSAANDDAATNERLDLATIAAADRLAILTANAVLRQDSGAARGLYYSDLYSDDAAQKGIAAAAANDPALTFQHLVAQADAVWANQVRLSNNNYEASFTSAEIGALTTINIADSIRDLSLSDADADYTASMAAATNSLQANTADANFDYYLATAFAESAANGRIAAARVGYDNARMAALGQRSGSLAALLLVPQAVADFYESKYLTDTAGWSEYVWGPSSGYPMLPTEAFLSPYMRPPYFTSSLGAGSDGQPIYRTPPHAVQFPTRACFGACLPVENAYFGPSPFSSGGTPTSVYNAIDLAFADAMGNAQVARAQALGDSMVQLATDRRVAAQLHAAAISADHVAFDSEVALANSNRDAEYLLARSIHVAAIGNARIDRVDSISAAEIIRKDQERIAATIRAGSIAAAEADYQLSVATQAANVYGAVALNSGTALDNYRAAWAAGAVQWIVDLTPGFIAFQTAKAQANSQRAVDVAIAEADRAYQKIVAETSYDAAMTSRELAHAASESTIQAAYESAMTDARNEYQTSAADNTGDYEVTYATADRQYAVEVAIAERTFQKSRFNNTSSGASQAQIQANATAERNRTVVQADARHTWRTDDHESKSDYAVAEANALLDQSTSKASLNDDTAKEVANAQRTRDVNIAAAEASMWNAETIANNAWRLSNANADVVWWTAQEAARVNAHTVIDVALATPWSEYLVEIANYRQSWWNIVAPAYMNWSVAKNGLETAYQNAKSIAYLTGIQATANADYAFAAATADIKEQKAADLAVGHYFYVIDMFAPSSNYADSVSDAQRDYEIAIAEALRTYKINGNISQRNAANAQATSAYDLAVKVARLAFKVVQATAYAAESTSSADADLGAAIATSDANVTLTIAKTDAETVRTIAESNLYLAGEVARASLERVFAEFEANQFATMMATFSTANPSPWANFDAGQAAARAMWTTATAVAQQTHRVAQAQTQRDTEVGIATARLALRTSEATNKGVIENDSASATHANSIDEIAAIQALSTSSGYEVELPTVSVAPQITGKYTVNATASTAYGVTTSSRLAISAPEPKIPREQAVDANFWDLQMAIDSIHSSGSVSQLFNRSEIRSIIPGTKEPTLPPIDLESDAIFDLPIESTYDPTEVDRMLESLDPIMADFWKQYGEISETPIPPRPVDEVNELPESTSTGDVSHVSEDKQSLTGEQKLVLEVRPGADSTEAARAFEQAVTNENENAFGTSPKGRADFQNFAASRSPSDLPEVPASLRERTRVPEGDKPDDVFETRSGQVMWYSRKGQGYGELHAIIGTMAKNGWVNLAPEFGGGRTTLDALRIGARSVKRANADQVQDILKGIRSPYHVEADAKQIGIFVGGTDMHINGVGNVERMYNLYQGTKFYYGGVGNPIDDIGIMKKVEGATGLSFSTILTRAVSDIVTFFRSGMKVHLFGFSRGAAAVNEIAKLLAARGISVDFLGLYDPVYSVGIAGHDSEYVEGTFDGMWNNYVTTDISKKAINAAVIYAANEDRSWFPATYLTPNGLTRIVSMMSPAGHAEIGGHWGVSLPAQQLNLRAMIEFARGHGGVKFAFTGIDSEVIDAITSKYGQQKTLSWVAKADLAEAKCQFKNAIAPDMWSPLSAKEFEETMNRRLETDWWPSKPSVQNSRTINAPFITNFPNPIFVLPQVLYELYDWDIDPQPIQTHFKRHLSWVNTHLYDLKLKDGARVIAIDKLAIAYINSLYERVRDPTDGGWDPDIGGPPKCR